MLKFRLTSLFALILVAAIVCSAYLYRHARRPISWQSFSEANLYDELSKGRIVVVYIHAASWLSSDIPLFDNPSVRYRINDSHVTAMRINYSDILPDDTPFDYGTIAPSIWCWSPQCPSEPVKLIWNTELTPELFGETISQLADD